MKNETTNLVEIVACKRHVIGDYIKTIAPKYKMYHFIFK